MSPKSRMVWTACLAVGLIWSGSAGAEPPGTADAEVAQMNSAYPVVLSQGIVGQSQTGTQGGSEEKKKREIKVKGFNKADTWIPYKNYFQRGFVGQEVEPVGKIIQGLRHHIAFSPVQYIFVEFEHGDDGPHPVDVKVGDRFRVVDQSETMRHPKKTFGITDEDEVDSMDFGYQGEFAYSLEFRKDEVGRKLRVKGVVEVVDLAPEGSVAKVKVLEGFDVMAVGDWLVPMPREKPEMVKINYQPPAKDIHGFLVGNQRTSIMSSAGDEVYIDKGAADNVAVGDRFEVYIVPEREEWFAKELTEHVVGELVVISTQEHTATTLIVNQTEPLLPGQKIRSKK